MRKKPYRPSEINPDPNKRMSPRQLRYIKVLCTDHLLRPESVARALINKPLAELSYFEAHRVIQHLEQYDESSEILNDEQIESDVGCKLDATEQRSSGLHAKDYILLLLALCRVATPGQIARFVFGINKSTYHLIRNWIEPMLDDLEKIGWVSRVRGVQIQIDGVGTTTDVIYLTEHGSDRVHYLAPHVNHLAKPGFPERRIYHDLGVTEAWLDRQAHRNFSSYSPESIMMGDQERARARERQGRRKKHRWSATEDGGCADFSGHEQDPRTGEWEYVEVEVSNLQRGEKLRCKPSRITHHYVSTKYLLDVVELSFGKIGKLIPDVRRPLKAGEELLPPPRRQYDREALDEARIAEVEAAFFDVMGGAATPHAIARIVGIQSNQASEVLNYLVDAGEVVSRDGVFPLSAKLGNRPRRLFRDINVDANSIYDFARLMTASQLVTDQWLNKIFKGNFVPINHNPSTGLLVFDEYEAPSEDLILVVIDDQSEMTARVVRWAQMARQQAITGSLQRTFKFSHAIKEPDFIAASDAEDLPVGEVRIVIATSDNKRAARLCELSSDTVINVAAEHENL